MLWKLKNKVLNRQRLIYILLAAWMLLVLQTVIIIHSYISQPALNQLCYNNKNPEILPVNSCCKIYNYTKKDIHRCIQNSMEFYSSLRHHNTGEIESQGIDNNASFQNTDNFSVAAIQHTRNTANTNVIHNIQWVVVGDSRVRQVFSALVSLLSGPRLKYKKISTMGKWRSIHELAESLRIGKLHEDIEVQHLELPINLRFYWDPLLQRLPTFLHQWTTIKSERPSLLLIGSGLHWMRNSLKVYHANGPVEASNKFKKYMEQILLQLMDTAALTDTIIQLQDPIQESRVFPKYQGVYSNENIDLYNSIIKSTFSNSGVVIWDSNIPLTHYYITQCQKHHQETFDKSWNCDNPFHPGFIVVEKFANILLNSICNEFLNFGDLYCNN